MNTKKEISLRGEKALKIVAVLILIIGIVISGILALTTIFIDPPQAKDYGEQIFNPIGLVITLGVMCLSIGICFFLIVIADIAIFLKKDKT